MSGSSHTMAPQFRWYLTGAASWFYAFGVQAVMFTYLVTTVLHAPANQIGIAQASLTVVSALLLLVGGTVADQFDARRVLMLCHATAMVPPAILALVLATGNLHFGWLIAYGLAMGTVTAFVLPAREAMLGDVVGPDGMRTIQRAVTVMVGTTFLAQILGMVTARFAGTAGPEIILCLQVLAQAGGIVATARLMPTHRHRTHGDEHGASQAARIMAGLRSVTSSPALFPITIITMCIGVLYIGSFLVVLPLIVREEFGGNVEQFSTMQVCFWGGSIISSLAISRVGNIVRRGRTIVLAVTVGGSMLALMTIPAPLWVLYAQLFTWGLGAGVMISMSRTTLQEYAEPALRARVMSIFQLGFTGGTAVGALLMGQVANLIGARHAVLVPAVCIAIVLTLLVLRTQVWHIRALHHAPPDGMA